MLSSLSHSKGFCLKIKMRTRQQMYDHNSVVFIHSLFKMHWSRYAAAEEESQVDKAKQTVENVYENIRERLDSAMLKMKSSLQNPRYRELIFYVLLSIIFKGRF